MAIKREGSVNRLGAVAPNGVGNDNSERLRGKLAFAGSAALTFQDTLHR